MKWLKQVSDGNNLAGQHFGNGAAGIHTLADGLRASRFVNLGLTARLGQMLNGLAVCESHDNLEGLRGCKALGNQGFDVHGGVSVWLGSFYASFIGALRDTVNDKFVGLVKI